MSGSRAKPTALPVSVRQRVGSVFGMALNWKRRTPSCILEVSWKAVRQSKVKGFVSGSPGVYLHTDVTQNKAEHYMRFVHLPPYSAFWAIEWEVKVFRPAHVRPPRATDQWIQPTQSVRLIALLVCAREAEELETSSPVSLPWTPMKEASPFTCQIVSPVALLPNGFLRKLCGKRIRL